MENGRNSTLKKVVLDKLKFLRKNVHHFTLNTMAFQGEGAKDVLFQTFEAPIGTLKPLILSSISKNLEDSSSSIEKSKEEIRQMAGEEMVIYEDSDSVFVKLPEGMHLKLATENFLRMMESALMVLSN